MSHSKNGTKEVISVGDESFPFDLDTNVAGTNFDSGRITIDRWDGGGTWTEVMDEPGNFFPTASDTVLRAVVPGTSPFNAAGRYRAQVVMQVTGGGTKRGDYYHFDVQGS